MFVVKKLLLRKTVGLLTNFRVILRPWSYEPDFTVVVCDFNFQHQIVSYCVIVCVCTERDHNDKKPASCEPDAVAQLFGERESSVARLSVHVLRLVSRHTRLHRHAQRQRRRRRRHCNISEQQRQWQQQQQQQQQWPRESPPTLARRLVRRAEALVLQRAVAADHIQVCAQRARLLAQQAHRAQVRVSGQHLHQPERPRAPQRPAPLGLAHRAGHAAQEPTRLLAPFRRSPHLSQS